MAGLFVLLIALAVVSSKNGVVKVTSTSIPTATAPTESSRMARVAADKVNSPEAKPSEAKPQEAKTGPVLFVNSVPPRYLSVAAHIVNPNPGLWLPASHYTATAYDASGVILGTEENVISLGPAEERWLVIYAMSAPGDVAKVDVQIRRDQAWRPASTYPVPPLTLLQANYVPDPSILHDNKLTGQFRNDGKIVVPQVRIDTVFLDSQGKLVGVSETFEQTVQPGQTVSFSASPAWPAASVKTYLITDVLNGLF